MQYLIYKQSGGLCHMLNQINNTIHLSKISKRFLIIDCIRGGAFKNDFNKYFHIPNFNYSTNYDCLYLDNSLNKEMFEPYIYGNAQCVGNYDYLNDKIITINTQKELQNNDKIIYCSWIYNIERFGEVPWYIKVNKDVVDKISINNLIEKYIGIQYRNTDMKHNLEEFIPKILTLSTKTNVIYLGTDDFSAFDRLNTLLNNKFKIIQYTKPINLNGQCIHYGNPNKDEIIMNALIDMYHLTYATYFIPSIKSSFSHRIIELRKKDEFFK